MVSMNLSNSADYGFVISGISKTTEAIKLMQNIDLTEKSQTLWNKNLWPRIKMSKESLTFGDIKIKKKKKTTAIRLLLL